jgi:hypothetical protein
VHLRIPVISALCPAEAMHVRAIARLNAEEDAGQLLAFDERIMAKWPANVLKRSECGFGAG